MVKEEWEKYYRSLEDIRVSGITNMYGAAPYLVELHPELNELEARDILINWMKNYSEIREKYGF